MATIILIRRGQKQDLPTEAPQGELLLTLDTGELFFGQGPGLPLKPVASQLVKGVDLSNQVDGLTKNFVVPEAFVPGSLEVEYNGVTQLNTVGQTVREITEVNPANGSFKFEHIVPMTTPMRDSVVAKYLRIII